MAENLITLPVRVSFGSARLLTRVAAGATGRALSLVGRTIGVVAPSPAKPAPGAPPRERPAAPARQPAPEPRHAPEPRQTSEPPEPRQAPEPRHAPTPPPPPEPPAPPAHVSEEPELVREEAEPGAEDGAGAAITVMEPWRGYAHMSARDVIDRARSANRAELAAVRLYESRHRSRQTVLAAVDRQLKLSNGGGPA
jgi:outer membrane biosynthesis protein TonB